MPRLAELFAVIASQYTCVRTGLDVGFGDEEVTNLLREAFRGLWLSIGARDTFPYEDAQFEVVVLNGENLTREEIREANRVLKPKGCAFFTVNEKTRKQEGYTLPGVYRMVREGFDIIAIKRPKWWHFGRRGRTITVCLRKKAWRACKSFVRPTGPTFTPFRERS